MWGNLAKGLKENLDVDALRNTISHVADVVAPPLHSDEEEYETDDEDEYEYYEEEEIVLDNTHAEEQGESLGSMLQHILDDEEKEHHLQQVKEQDDRYNTRPVLPNDDDDIEEEVISFEQEEAAPVVLEEKPLQNSVANNNAVPASAVVAEPTRRSASPTVPASVRKHFPGVPVPHVHKEMQSVTKERILRTEPVRDESPDVPAQNLRVPSPMTNTTQESATANMNLPVNDSLVDSTTEPATSSVDESKPESREAMLSNGRQTSLSPLLVDPLPTPAVNTAESLQETKPANSDTVPANESESMVPTPPTTRNDKAETRTSASPVPSAPARQSPPPVLSARVPSPVPPPAPPKKQSPPVPSTRAPSPVPPAAPPKPIPTRTNGDEQHQESNARSAPSPTPPTPTPPQNRQSPTLQSSTNGGTNDDSQARDEVPIHKTTPPKKPNTQELLKKANDVVNKSKKDDANEAEMLKMQRKCKDLETQLQHAELHIVELQRDAAQRMDEEEEWRASHLQSFQEEQARIVEAATEAAAMEHERDIAEMRDLLQQECFALKDQLESERRESQRQAERYELAVRQAESRAETMEAEKRRAETKQKSSISQLQQQQDHAVRMTEDKLAHTLAKLDDREEEVAKLKAAIKELKASTTEHREVAQEAEEEMDELHAENETLQHNLRAVQAERDELNKQLKLFDSQKEKMHGLQMELRMLKEARDRERAHRQNAAVSAESNQAELEAERDVALSTARDIERQLKATLADLEIAKADADRIMMANVNLQSALEAFQSERDAEMGMIEEQRAEAEQATSAAHAAAIEATIETNEARMREVQVAADAAVRNVMQEVNELERKLEASHRETVNLRRSLDEAIHRLQTSQEDVIDRVLMKNILLDWFSKNGKGKRDVLALMASVLHFTEEEKDAIHIGDHSGTFGKVVGAVAAPLPPSAADIDHLEGDTVGEKWVSFLMAEAGDDESEQTSTSPQSSEPPTENGDAR